MDFEDLKNSELQKKLKSARTSEDILVLVKEEGYELTDGQLDGVSGGWGCWENGCVDDAPCGGYLKGKRPHAKIRLLCACETTTRARRLRCVA